MILPTTPAEVRAFIANLNRIRDDLLAASLVDDEHKAALGMQVRGADAKLSPPPGDDMDDAEFAESLADAAFERFDKAMPRFKGLMEAE